MKPILLITSLTALIALHCHFGSAVAAEAEGVAVAIIYDTSGSMKDPVQDKAGRSSPKYVIANRALASIARQLKAFSQSSSGGAPRNVEVGVFTFQGENAKETIKFGPLDAPAIERWAEKFSSPNGNTPLGNALATASKRLLESPLPRKHILVVTDGINTAGPEPGVVLPKMQKRAEEKQTTLGVHFVAFDVDAKVFDPVKRLGATVVSAADEKELNAQLEYIMQRKILLEDEETPKK